MKLVDWFIFGYDVWASRLNFMLIVLSNHGINENLCSFFKYLKKNDTRTFAQRSDVAHGLLV